MTRPVILTVDDDPQVLAAIATDLRKRYSKDYRIVRAASAAEALDALRGLKEGAEPVALLLSDQRMPGHGRRGISGGGQRVVPGGQAGAADGLRRYRCGHCRHQHSRRWTTTCRSPGIRRSSNCTRSSTNCSTIGARSTGPATAASKVIGSRYMPTVHQIKDFLARNHVPYEFFDVEATDERGAESRALAEGATLPLVMLPGGERLRGALARRPGAEGRAQRRGQGRHLRRRDCRRRSRRPGGGGVRGVGRAATRF